MSTDSVLKDCILDDQGISDPVQLNSTTKGEQSIGPEQSGVPRDVNSGEALKPATSTRLMPRTATAVAASFSGKKAKILSEARTVRTKGATMMKTYLERGSDELDGFEFLTMAEAGEVGHWSALQELNKQAKHTGIRRLVSTHLPIQKRHLKDAMAASVQLAAKEDANAEA